LESEQFYRNLFSSLRDVFFAVDAESRIMNANQPALRDLFEYELEDVADQNTRFLYADEDGYKMIGRKISENVGPNVPVIAEVKFRKKNGNVFIGEISVQKLRNDKGDFVGSIVMIRDITEQKKLEEQYLQSQKMESIGTLASGIAHDFNNILSAIIGYSDMTIMKMERDDPQRLNIECILEAAEKAAYLTKDLLQQETGQ
jgi:PAS domain S-box-containing protein